MKTTIEINGYEITIEETEGMVSVSASKDGEIVEQFELESGESQESEEDSDDEKVMPFGEEGEEDDFEGEGEHDEEIEHDEEEEKEEKMKEEEPAEEGALESFSSFFNRSKVKKINETKKIVKSTTRRK